MVRRPTDEQLKRSRAVRSFVRNDSELFLQEHGGSAVGLGFKIRAGKPTGDLAIRLFVPKGRKGNPNGKPVDPVVRLPDPDEGDELEFGTDVDECDMGELHNGFNPEVSQRPMPGGVSIGSAAGTGGTLGGWAWDAIEDRVVLLSNSHVLGQVDAKSKGISVRQPAVQPLGVKGMPEEVGSLLRADGNSKELVRNVDCAIASVTDVSQADFSVREMGAAIMAVGSPQLWTRVRKYGVTTRLRTGRVTSPFWSGYIEDGRLPDGTPRQVLFRDCIKVEAPNVWAKKGDSGALVFANVSSRPATERAVFGLHFAGEKGTDAVGYACRIDDVFEALGITTLPCGAARSVVAAACHPENREAAMATLAELWLRLASSGRDDPVRALFKRHRARVTDLVIRDEGIRARAAQVVAPFVGEGQSLDRASGVVIDDTVRLAVASFCEAVIARAESDDVVAACKEVIAWVGSQVGRTLNDALGLGVQGEPSAAPRPSPRHRTAQSALRAYLLSNDVELLKRYGAIGVRIGPNQTIVLEFASDVPKTFDPVTFDGYTFDVTGVIGHRVEKK